MDKKKEIEWMRGSHYHCKKCGQEIKYLLRVSWKVGSGVRVMGVCENCSLIMIEYEYERTVKWVKFK